jgi:hypothetical protein
VISFIMCRILRLSVTLWMEFHSRSVGTLGFPNYLRNYILYLTVICTAVKLNQLITHDTYSAQILLTHSFNRGATFIQYVNLTVLKYYKIQIYFLKRNICKSRVTRAVHIVLP